MTVIFTEREASRVLALIREAQQLTQAETMMTPCVRIGLLDTLERMAGDYLSIADKLTKGQASAHV